MSFIYFHAAAARRVFKVPTTPEISGDERSGFRVSITYSDIQASNRIVPSTGQWNTTVQPYVEQAFSPIHTKQQAIEYFMARHCPKGEAITEAQYEALAAAYEAEAMSHSDSS